jgi:8-amino-7-oxononanoate synthase
MEVSTQNHATTGTRDILEKCRNYGRVVAGRFMRPSDVQAAGLYVYFEVFGDREGCAPGEARIQGRKILMFGSNDYLDLTTHPKVKEAALQALRRYGTSCSGARILNGTLDLHIRLESELAALTRKEDALIFGTGFQTNHAVLSTLAAKGDVLVCDHNLHASLVEGTLQSTVRTIRFRHNDMDHLERCLRHCSPEEGILIVSEGVFSMEGDLADLPGTVALAKRHGTRVYVDEAHGIGVLGPTGAGAAEHFGVLDDVDIVMGTFSKSLASIGGFVASSRAVIAYLKHNARPFIFSASAAPSAVAAASAALEIIRQEPERRQRPKVIADLLRRELRSGGFPVLDGGTPIVPVVVEDEFELFRACKLLLEDGIYVNPVLRPASDHNILRISCTAAHTEGQVTQLVEGLRKALCNRVTSS